MKAISSPKTDDLECVYGPILCYWSVMCHYVIMSQYLTTKKVGSIIFIEPGSNSDDKRDKRGHSKVGCERMPENEVCR